MPRHKPLIICPTGGAELKEFCRKSIILICITCLAASLLAGCRAAPAASPTLAPTRTAGLQSSPTRTPQQTKTATEPIRTSTPSRAPLTSPTPVLLPTQDVLKTLSSTRFNVYTGIEPARSFDPGIQGWRGYTFDPAECGCIFGEEFSILVRAGKESTKTVFWLNGGGACWPGQEACANHFNLATWTPEAKLASQEAANPLRDWNFIFIPSCDGSFFIGDHQADYSGNGTIDHTHWGLRNTSAAAALTRQLFPATQQILIAGCSAGGYGTLAAAPIVRLQFPQAQLSVFNESGQGLFDPRQADTWENLRDAWGLDTVLPAGCPSCRDQLIYLVPWMLGLDPSLRIGMYSSYRDSVIGQVYLGMIPEAFEQLLLNTTDAIHAQYPDTFKRFFVNGSSHCIEDYTVQVNGLTIFEWIDAMISDPDTWQDVLETGKVD